MPGFPGSVEPPDELNCAVTVISEMTWSNSLSHPVKVYVTPSDGFFVGLAGAVAEPKYGTVCVLIVFPFPSTNLTVHEPLILESGASEGSWSRFVGTFSLVVICLISA